MQTGTLDLMMPPYSPTMEKGTLARWLVAVGDAVKAGDFLAQIETDKATMEYEAVDEGTIAEIIVVEVMGAHPGSPAFTLL